MALNANQSNSRIIPLEVIGGLITRRDFQYWTPKLVVISNGSSHWDLGVLVEPSDYRFWDLKLVRALDEAKRYIGWTTINTGGPLNVTDPLACLHIMRWQGLLRSLRSAIPMDDYLQIPAMCEYTPNLSDATIQKLSDIMRTPFIK